MPKTESVASSDKSTTGAKGTAKEGKRNKTPLDDTSFRKPPIQAQKDEKGHKRQSDMSLENTLPKIELDEFWNKQRRGNKVSSSAL